MAQGYYRQVTLTLKKYGYAYKENAKGGHEKWVHKKTGRVQIIPSPVRSRHTANQICKDIGAEKKF